jgi:excinuclease ABC subunit C
MRIRKQSDFDGRLVPTDPGVYLFKDGEGTILYCGKAKNLRNRVGNYFSSPERLAIKTRLLVSKIEAIDWIVVRTEVEALLLENKLIKQHSPKYNINLKDAKTFAYIALTRERFPRVLSSRRTGPKLDSFGPYTDATARRELQKLVAGIFKLRTCRTLPKKACLDYHIGICTAPCIGKVTEEEYRRQVEGAKVFLNGGYGQTVEMLAGRMKEASREGKYELALELRNQLGSINLLSKRQIVDHERHFDQDILAFKKVGERVIVVRMEVRKGVLMGKRDFEMEYQENFEREFLRAFYASNRIPREIILNKACWADDGEKAAIEAFFAQSRGAPVTLTVPVKGEKRELIELAGKNIEVNLEHDGALVDLQNALNLPTLPVVIESFDVSNIGDEHIVSGMVRFVNAKPDRSGYRKFRLRTVVGADDYASIREVVYRRYRRLIDEGTEMPDLILIDGGAEQLNAARDALGLLGLTLPMIGLAKKREEIYLPGEVLPRRFDNNSKMMLLVRRIRDATHGFSLSYNRKRRQMKMRDEFKEQAKE